MVKTANADKFSTVWYCITRMRKREIEDMSDGVYSASMEG
jgi:hypothetical protein